MSVEEDAENSVEFNSRVAKLESAVSNIQLDMTSLIRMVRDLQPVKREIDEIFATDRMEAVNVDVKERKEGCRNTDHGNSEAKGILSLEEDSDSEDSNIPIKETNPGVVEEGLHDDRAKELSLLTTDEKLKEWTEKATIYHLYRADASDIACAVENAIRENVNELDSTSTHRSALVVIKKPKKPHIARLCKDFMRIRKTIAQRSLAIILPTIKHIPGINVVADALSRLDIVDIPQMSTETELRGRLDANDSEEVDACPIGQKFRADISAAFRALTWGLKANIHRSLVFVDALGMDTDNRNWIYSMIDNAATEIFYPYLAKNKTEISIAKPKLHGHLWNYGCYNIRLWYRTTVY